MSAGSRRQGARREDRGSRSRLLRTTPAREQIMCDAELVERLSHAVVDEVVDRLRKDVEAWYRRQDRRAVEGELVHRLQVTGVKRRLPDHEDERPALLQM